MEKIALITGGSRGIGKALAQQFAQDGYSLILIARDLKALEKIQKEFQDQYHCEVKILSADFQKRDCVDLILQTFKDDLEKIEVLVNNAGFGVAQSFVDTPQEDIDGMMTVNMFVVTNLMYKILPYMLAQGRGKILNVASTAGFQPGPYFAVYYATKAYIISLSLAVSEEYKKQGVFVSVLCPGPIETEFHQRAKTDEQNLLFLKFIKKLPVETLAKIGYKAFKRNKRLIIPGFLNKLGVLSVRFSPSLFTTMVVGRLNKSN